MAQHGSTLNVATHRPYKLFYDLKFDFNKPNVMLKEDSGDPAREQRVQYRVDSVKASIEKNGLTNPIIVYMKPDGRYKVHPGMCRVNAVKALGWDFIPALIIDKHGQYPKWGDMGVLISPEDAVALFSDDYHVVWDDGKFWPKLLTPKFKGEPWYPDEEHRTSAGKRRG